MVQQHNILEWADIHLANKKYTFIDKIVYRNI